MDNTIYQDWGSQGEHSSATLHEIESPFISSPTAATASIDAMQELEEHEFASPFLASTQVAEEGETFDLEEQLFVQFRDELAMEEFTESVVNLFNEGERYLDYHVGLTPINNEIIDPFRREELLVSHFQPLAVATEQLMDQLEHEFSSLGNTTITDAEIDGVFQKYQTTHELGNLIFEDFFKKAFRKIKRAAKKVAKLVKKGAKIAGRFHPLAILMRKVKKMIRPFLTKIIRKVIRKLPSALRSPARMLARKLGIRAELQLTSLEMVERHLADDEPGADAYLFAAGPDLEFLEREFDLRLAEQLFASTEEEARDVFDAYIDDREDQEAAVTEEQLFRARKELTDVLQTATTVEEVGPTIEQFLSVALKAVKLGIRVIGRKKVINKISQLFAKFIGKLIGPKAAAPLAKALVEKGFRLLNLEVTEEEAGRATAESLVQILDEMTEELVTMDHEILQNPELLEQEMHRLFRQYSARNMPSNMIVEELQEAEEAAAWVLLPKNGRKRYKKYSRVVETSLSRVQIKGVQTFNGQYLRPFLRQRYQQQSAQPLKVRIHLYEAVRGTTLSHISLLEKKTPGLGSARRRAWSQVHPLTPEAASQLLGNASLGQRVSERWLTSRHRIRPGQRFYYLEVVGMARIDHSPPQGIASRPSFTSRPAVRQEDAMVKLDFTRSTMTLGLFVTEDKSNEITRRLRAQDYFGAATTFRTAIRDTLNDILLRDIGKKVKVVMELREEQYLEEHFGSLLAVGAVFAKDQLKKLMGKLLEKLVRQAEKALANHLRRLRDDFIRAQEDPASGLSLHLVFIDMPGMAIIRTFFKLKQGKPLSVGDFTGSVLPSIPTPDLRIFPGKKSL